MKRKLPHFLAALLFTGAFVTAQTQQRPSGQNASQATAKATIEGTVVRADNSQPLKGARVMLQAAGPRAQAPLTAGTAVVESRLTNLAFAIATVTTDGNGRFTFTGVDPGQYQLSAERDGFVRSEYGQRTATGNGIAIPVSANQRLTIDLKMLQGSVVSGRIINADGEPASQLRVNAYTYRYSNGQRTLAEVTNVQTNDLGEYRLYWLSPGEYFVSVSSSDAFDTNAIGTVDVGQARGAREGGVGAAIRLYAPALADNAGPIVKALGGVSNPPIFYPGTIDPDGAIPITVPASVEVRGVDFNLRPIPTATVSGRVVAPFPLNSGPSNVGIRGRGAAGAQGGPAQFFFGDGPVQLSLNRVGNSRAGLAGLLAHRLGSTPVNPDGSFEMKGVAPGEYNLTATARDQAGQQYTARTQVSVGSSDVANVTVTMRPGVEVRGRILLDGTPPQQFAMSNLRVSLVTEDLALPGMARLFLGAGGATADIVGEILPGGQLETAEVAADGSFTLRDVGAMEYRVRVLGLPQGAYLQAGRIDSNDALNAPFAVGSQGAQLQLQLGFSPGRVSGTVADERGAATAGVQAVLVPDEPRRGRGDAYFSATTDQNGQFAFTTVPPGRYKLFAWEEIPAGAYEYPDFIRKYEDRGQSVTVNPSGAITADARLIRAN